MNMKNLLLFVLSCWIVLQLSGCAALTGSSMISNAIQGTIKKKVGSGLAKPTVEWAVVPGVENEKINRINKIAFVPRESKIVKGTAPGGNQTHRVLADNLIIHMMQSGYHCLESHRLIQSLKDQGIQWEDSLELDNLLIKTAYALGAQAVISATFQGSGDLIRNVSLKVIDAENTNPLMYLAINYKQPKFPYIAAKNIAKILNDKLRGVLDSPNKKPVPSNAQQTTKPVSSDTLQPSASQPDNKIDLSDIKRESYKEKIKQAEARKKWADWQNKFQSEFNKIKAIDHDTTISLKSKKKAWRKLLDTYNQDNPNTWKDQRLKQFARTRIKFWEEFSTNESISIPGNKLASLRSRYLSIRTTDVRTMLYKYNFFSANWHVNEKYCNPEGSFNNQFIVGKKVIADASTGLMWERSGSPYAMEYKYARKWISMLNSNKFAGYRNWRLPTLEEAASLLRKKKTASLRHKNENFSKEQAWIWTGDPKIPRRVMSAVWAVDFFTGHVHTSYYFSKKYVRAVRTAQSVSQTKAF